MGVCVWVKRPRANTQACEVKDLIIEKGKKPSHRKRKRKQAYCQNIDPDVRAPEDTNPKDEEYLRKFTKRICHLKHTPVILPLFKKLYGTPEKDTITGEPGHSNHNRPKTGIMRAKLLEILTNDPKTSTEEIVKILSKYCLSLILNESRLREQPPSNGNVKSGTFIRQGLSQPQSAKEFLPARKRLRKTQLKMPKS